MGSVAGLRQFRVKEISQSGAPRDSKGYVGIMIMRGLRGLLCHGSHSETAKWVFQKSAGPLLYPPNVILLAMRTSKTAARFRV